MKTLVTAFAVSFLAVGLAASQNPQVQNPPVQNPPAQAQPTQDPQKTPVEVTLTGCLVQGSTPAVFLFENARKDPKSTTETPVKYVVVAGTEDLNFRAHLNHQVTVTGTPDGKIAPPSSQKVEEKDLPRLSAKALTMVSDTCSTTVR
jgi:hypothetical protein